MSATRTGAVDDREFHTVADVLVFLSPQASRYKYELGVARVGQQNASTGETNARQELLDANAQLGRLQAEIEAPRGQVRYVYSMCVRTTEIVVFVDQVDCDEV